MSRRAMLVLVVVGVLAFATSAAAHLATDPGRAAARDLMVAVINSRIRGTASIDAVRRIDLDGVELEGFRVRAPSGTVVIEAHRMEAEIVVLEIFRSGRLRMAPATLEGGTMRITRGPNDQIDLVYAMEVPRDRWMPIVDIHEIRLVGQTMVFDLPGAPRVEMARVSGSVDMTLGHRFACRMDGVEGVVDVPVVDVGFEHLSGRIQSDDATPLEVQMVLDLDVAEPGLRIRYEAPRVGGRDEDPGLSVTLGVHAS